MPKRSERSKKKKYRRSVSGKAVVDYIEGKTGKKKCALCKEQLHGVPHGKRKSEIMKLSKSKKRPSTMFGGMLCTKCRSIVVEDAIKVKYGTKEMEKVSLNIKNYVESALKRVE